MGIHITADLCIWLPGRIVPLSQVAIHDESVGRQRIQHGIFAERPKVGVDESRRNTERLVIALTQLQESGISGLGGIAAEEQYTEQKVDSTWIMILAFCSPSCLRTRSADSIVAKFWNFSRIQAAVKSKTD